MDEDAGLIDEVTRLRAENAALSRRVARRETARRAGVVTLLVLGCGLAALSVLAIWLRVTLLNTDRYVSTVGPIAEQPAVQKAVADKLNTAIDARVDLDGLVRQVLPDKADALAPALTAGLSSAIHKRVDEFTASPRFEQAWTEANRRAHTRLVALLTGGRSKRLVLQGNTVYVDFGADVERVRAQLQQRGFDRLAAVIPSDVDGRVPILESHALVHAQKGVKLLKGLAILLPLLALACLAGMVALSRPRRRGLRRAAIGVALAMVILMGAVAVARSAYLDALGNGALPRDAAAGIFDSVAALLRHGVRIVVVVALLLGLATLISELPLGRLTAAAAARTRTDPRVAWVAHHERALQLAAVAIGGLALLLWSPLTGGVVVIDLLLVALAVAAVRAVAAAQLTRAQVEPERAAH